MAKQHWPFSQICLELPRNSSLELACDGFDVGFLQGWHPKPIRLASHHHEPTACSGTQRPYWLLAPKMPLKWDMANFYPSRSMLKSSMISLSNGFQYFTVSLNMCSNASLVRYGMFACAHVCITQSNHQYQHWHCTRVNPLKILSTIIWWPARPSVKNQQFEQLTGWTSGTCIACACHFYIAHWKELPHAFNSRPNTGFKRKLPQQFFPVKKGGTKEGFPIQQFDQTHFLQPIQDVNVLEKMILAQPPDVHFPPPSQTNFSNGWLSPLPSSTLKRKWVTVSLDLCLASTPFCLHASVCRFGPSPRCTKLAYKPPWLQ